MYRSRSIFALASAALLAALAANSAAAGGMSEASEFSAVGAGSIVAGSLVAVADGSQMVVEAVQDIGHGLKVTLRGAAQTVRAVLILPLKLAGGASLAVGQTVVVVTHGAGWLITQAGRVLAFVPNETGQALLFSRPAHGS